MKKSADLKPEVKLRPHQQRIADDPADGLIVAHAPGGGKTLSGIARFERRRAAGKALQLAKCYGLNMRCQDVGNLPPYNFHL